LKILLSSLACSPHLGSEALTGFNVVQALSRHHDVELVTSAGMVAPEQVQAHTLGVQFKEPNDVGAAQLFRFELQQRLVVERLLRRESFGVLHRVTPSGYKHSLLPVPSLPLVMGPVLGSDPPPASFQDVFRPKLPGSFSPKALVARAANGLARRLFDRFSTLHQLMEKAALILVGTEVTRRRLPERLHPRCRLLTYAGVEHDRFTPPPAGRVSALPQLLFVGRVVPYKGVELLLRAAALACQRCRFELKIVGNGFPPYERCCRALAAELKLTDVVSFIGAVPRSALVEFYRAADIFCMPSIETYGIAVLEAMSSGCAVLVADANGPGEIVPPGTGLKVPLESPEQFVEEYAQLIIKLIESNELRRDLGERAREHVVEHHDCKRIGASLLDIYQEVSSNTAAVAQDARHCSATTLA
jgi:glycosyltransferase involved in cell wall biosynthesis